MFGLIISFSPLNAGRSIELPQRLCTRDHLHSGFSLKYEFCFFILFLLVFRKSCMWNFKCLSFKYVCVACLQMYIPYRIWKVTFEMQFLSYVTYERVVLFLWIRLDVHPVSYILCSLFEITSKCEYSYNFWCNDVTRVYQFSSGFSPILYISRLVDSCGNFVMVLVKTINLDQKPKSVA